MSDNACLWRPAVFHGKNSGDERRLHLHLQILSHITSRSLGGRRDFTKNSSRRINGKYSIINTHAEKGRVSHRRKCDSVIFACHWGRRANTEGLKYILFLHQISCNLVFHKQFPPSRWPLEVNRLFWAAVPLIFQLRVNTFFTFGLRNGALVMGCWFAVRFNLVFNSYSKIFNNSLFDSERHSTGMFF